MPRWRDGFRCRTFRVAAGVAKIAAGNAVNGLDIVLSDDATLALDLASSDADLAAYGIVNILTPGAPFAVDGTAEKVVVDLALAANDAGADEVPVVTVKATDADSVDALLKVRLTRGDGREHTLATSRKPVTIGETACVTFTVNTTVPGLILLIR